jgi:hypothetical protein
MFTVQGVETPRVPVDLEISLLPDSSRAYELVDGPVRVTTPVWGQPSKVVWATVRATGSAPVIAKGRSRELSPELIFQANVKSGAAQTLAYGQKCRVSPIAADAAKKLASADGKE